jgi:hypothetical protein
MNRSLVALLATLFCAQAAQGAEPGLSTYLWKHRLLLAFGDPVRLKQQAEAFRRTEDGARERDLLLIEVPASGPVVVLGAPTSAQLNAAELRRAFRVGSGFTALLVGKDGTEKLRSPRPVSLTEIFDVIDAMPMRQQEARTRRR